MSAEFNEKLEKIADVADRRDVVTAVHPYADGVVDETLPFCSAADVRAEALELIDLERLWTQH